MWTIHLHPSIHILRQLVYDVYQSLLVQGIQPKDIILSGDSCGANLALALCLRLKEQPELMPSTDFIVTFSRFNPNQ